MALLHKRPTHSPSSDGSGMEDISISIHEAVPGKVPLHTKSDSSGSSEDTALTRDGFWTVALDDNDDSSLPTWSGNPQAPADRVQPSILSTVNKRNYMGQMLFIGFVLVGLTAILSSRETVRKATQRLSQLEDNKYRVHERLKNNREQVISLKRKMSALKPLIEEQNENQQGSQADQTSAMQAMESLQNRLASLGELSDSLKEKVKRRSRENIESTYGDGIQRVELELVFPDRKVGPHKFTIELASKETMPHSVDTFLRMVSSGLLDGCSFILNAMHVVKAAPLPYDGTSAAEKAKAFTAHGLESVAFREYNKTYPHQQFTVGFAADGSPSFYINTEDNTEIHVGDPCFGKIVEGFDTIRRLEASPTRNGIWFERRIGIKTARVL